MTIEDAIQWGRLRSDQLASSVQNLDREIIMSDCHGHTEAAGQLRTLRDNVQREAEAMKLLHEGLSAALVGWAERVTDSARRPVTTERVRQYVRGKLDEIMGRLANEPWHSRFQSWEEALARKKQTSTRSSWDGPAYPMADLQAQVTRDREANNGPLIDMHKFWDETVEAAARRLAGEQYDEDPEWWRRLADVACRRRLMLHGVTPVPGETEDTNQ